MHVFLKLLVYFIVPIASERRPACIWAIKTPLYHPIDQ